MQSLLSRHYCSNVQWKDDDHAPEDLNWLLFGDFQNSFIIFIYQLNTVSFDQEELRLVLSLKYMVNLDLERLSCVTLSASLAK